MRHQTTELSSKTGILSAPEAVMSNRSTVVHHTAILRRTDSHLDADRTNPRAGPPWLTPEGVSLLHSSPCRKILYLSQRRRRLPTPLPLRSPIPRLSKGIPCNMSLRRGVRRGFTSALSRALWLPWCCCSPSWCG